MNRRRLGAGVCSALVAGLLVATGGSPGSTAAPAPAEAPGSPGAARGTWQVMSLGDGRHRVEWTSPVRVPVGSDRPTVVGPDSLVVGPSTLAANGRTVTAVVVAASPPRPGQLDVVLSGDRLDHAGQDRNAAAPGLRRPSATAAPARDLLDADPGAPGEFDVVSSDYQLDPVKLPRMREPIEMVGHVVEPVADAATGPRPLVLFLHGRHSFCYKPGTQDMDFRWPCRPPFSEIPSHLGYDYIQQILASQGFATVSVRVNGINAQDFALEDGGADARAAIVQRHLDRWTGLAAEHQVDLDQVVLVGHSRGGEGVNRASIRVPLSAPYRIAGQVLLAPTDFASQTAPYVPTVTVLPYCDGDVYDLQGQKFTDVGRDLTSDDSSLKSSVLVMGANHNFFNTEWTPGVAVAPSWDDWFGPKDQPCGRQAPDRLSKSGQRAVGTAYVAGAARLFTGEQEFLPLFDGSAATVSSIGDAEVLSHAIGGGRNLRRAALDTTLTLAEGAETQFCEGITDFNLRFGRCGRRLANVVTPHWPLTWEPIPTRRWFEMSWESPGATGGMDFNQPLDLTDGRLEMRTAVDHRRGGVDVSVRLTDVDGNSAELVPEADGVLPALLTWPGVTKLWAQTLVVETSGASGIDLSRVDRVELVGESDRGRIWVSEVAAAPETLAAVPERRTPVVSLSRVRMDEGDGSGNVIGRLPFQVAGDVSRASRFTVLVASEQRGSQQRLRVDLAPGQTSGNIPVEYQSDNLDDLGPDATSAVAWPVRGVMTDAWVGGLTVVDDDPTPKVTVRAVDRTIREGQAARWRVSIAGRVDYAFPVSALVVRGPGRDLTVGDLPGSAIPRWVPPDLPRSTPLHRIGLFYFQRLVGRDLSATFRIPTRRDGAREGRESLTLRIDVPRKTYKKTFFVTQ